jgi:hypothetical protein
MGVTIIQPSNADTYISSEDPYSNYGTNTSMWIGYYYGGHSYTDTTRSLIKFDLSSISASSIFDSVILSLWLLTDFANSDVVWKVYRVKKNWTEIGASWNNYSSGAAWQVAGATGANDIDTVEIGTSETISSSTPVNTEIKITLSALEIQKMFDGTYNNYGFLIIGIPETIQYGVYRRWYVYTRENTTTAYRPKLTVTTHIYDPVPYGTYDQYTKALLHFDNFGDQYYFRDELQNSWTPCRYASSASYISGSGPYIITSQKKFGTGSGYFAGSALGDWIQIQTDFGFRGNDFTIDGQFYFNDLNPNDYNKGLFGEATNGVILNTDYQGLWLSCISASSTDYYFRYRCQSSGSLIIHGIGEIIVPISIGNWNHIALVRNGNNWNGYFNGISYLSFSSGSVIPDPTLTSQFFKIGQNGGSGWFNGDVDEFRISVGIARWTSNFTPPEYPYSANSNPRGQPVMYSSYPWM